MEQVIAAGSEGLCQKQPRDLAQLEMKYYKLLFSF